MSDQTGGIWLPSPDMWSAMFGANSPEDSFLRVVTKAPTSTLSEINRLAASMGLTVKLQVERKKPAGEKP